MSVICSGQENGTDSIPSPQLPKRLTIDSIDYILFTSDEEEILIKKMYYKEIYKQSSIQWMTLWELEYDKTRELEKIIANKNIILVNKDAQLELKDRRISSLERDRQFYRDSYEQCIKKRFLEKKGVKIAGGVLAFGLGYYIAKIPP